MSALCISPSTHDDREVVEEALLVRSEKSSDGLHEVFLGPKELKIWLDLLEAYQECKTPLASDLIIQIVKKHSKAKNPYVMLNKLEKKGVLQSSEDKSINRSRIPLTLGLRVVTGPAHGRRQVWPEVSKKTSEIKPTSKKKKISALTEECLLPDPTNLGDGKPWVVSSECSPAVLTKHRCAFYETLMSFARANDHRLLSPKEIRSFLKSVNANPSMMFYFDHKFGLTFQVSGKLRSKSDPLLRAVVFAPYILKGESVVHIPDECSLLNVSEDTPELDSIPVSESSDPSSETVILTGRLRSKEELQHEFDEIDHKIKQTRKKALAQIFADHDSLIKQQESRVKSLQEELKKSLNELQALTDQREEKANTVVSDKEAGVEGMIERRDRLHSALDHHDVLVAILIPSMYSTD